MACNNSNTNKDNTTNNNQPKEKSKFKVLNTSSTALNLLKYNGKIVGKKFWKDTNGENIVLFTKQMHELFVYHYSINGDDIKLLRKVYDFSEKGCEYDLFADFVSNATTVTDLDNNNLGEITFAYKLACISDLSPIGLKLLVLENGNKYIIRGNTQINMGKETIGGDKNIDPSFEKAPASFLQHANKIWERIQ